MRVNEQGEYAEDDAEASGDFASLDEFAHILEGAGGDEITAKQKEWEARIKKNKGSFASRLAEHRLALLPRRILTYTHCAHDTGKKKAASDDEDDGDVFEDMDDSASGEEDEAGDFNFASKYVVARTCRYAK
jgi:hypothetical protein